MARKMTSAVDGKTYDLRSLADRVSDGLALPETLPADVLAKVQRKAGAEARRDRGRETWARVVAGLPGDGVRMQVAREGFDGRGRGN